LPSVIFSWHCSKAYVNEINDHIYGVDISDDRFVVSSRLVQYPDRASIPIFPKWATSFIEVLILAVYVADMLFKRSFLLRGTTKNRESAWLADNNYYVTFVAIVLTFIDIALSLILRVGWPDVRYLRWSVFFRVWFTIYFFRDVRHYFKNLKKTLPEIGHVFAVFFGFIFFFVLMVMTLVQDGGGDEKYVLTPLKSSALPFPKSFCVPAGWMLTL
jgi:hypothetical protein